MSKNKENCYDVIVIGSGLGGMATAALLTKINKKKVLVLERHSEFGGLTHEFKRGPYTWDVGLHYIGNLSHNKSLYSRMMFDFITDGKMKWNSLPEVFDKIHMPGKEISISGGTDNYISEMAKAFPESRKEIENYVKDIERVKTWYLNYFYADFLHGFPAWVYKMLSLRNRDKALMTLSEYLHKYISDPKLRLALSSRWGNYGLPADKIAFAAHALVEEHYYEGASFPSEGSGVIGAYIEHTLEEYGSTTRTNAEVTQILLDKHNRAYGVRVRDLASADKAETEYYAPCIVSAVGAMNTYGKLLPSSLGLDIQKKIKAIEPIYSGVNIYFGLRESPEKLGLKGENHWFNESLDIDNYANEWQGLTENKATYCFLSFPTMKLSHAEGEKVAHSADVIAVLPYSLFSKWSKEEWKQHEKEYYELKDKIIDSVLTLIDKYIPGFSDLVCYKEMATPLTFEHFTNQPMGNFYGLPETPDRYKIEELRIKTPIKGLYMTGTDILSNGIVPAIMSGMGTAVYINGFWGIIKVMKNLMSYKPTEEEIAAHSIFRPDAEQNKASNKAVGTLINITPLNDNVQEMTFQFGDELHLIAGQHVKLNVGVGQWRAYSVARYTDKTLTLIIDTRPNGIGIKYIKKLQLGQKSTFRIPISDLIYHESDNDKVFIGTGTGFVPFISMLDHLKSQKCNKKITCLFGCLNNNDNFIERYLAEYKDALNIDTHIYIENMVGEKSSADDFSIKQGRVTDILTNDKFDYSRTDFYICGHQNMTDSAVRILRILGAKNIYY
ncbi:MAG: NAD(P)-binding protein [Spirochaetales bacterium]|nr:NAD(P)-binding protein [Spirochaetales bacterium]